MHRFDVNGWCIYHPNIQLCRPKPTSGQYSIVRKCCHLCGEHALVNKRKVNKQHWAHGYKATAIAKRPDIPKEPTGVSIRNARPDDSTRPTRQRLSNKSTTKSQMKMLNSRLRKLENLVVKQPVTPERRIASRTPPASPESDASRSEVKSVYTASTGTTVSSSSASSGRSNGTRDRLLGAVPTRVGRHSWELRVDEYQERDRGRSRSKGRSRAEARSKSIKRSKSRTRSKSRSRAQAKNRACSDSGPKSQRRPKHREKQSRLSKVERRLALMTIM